MYAHRTVSMEGLMETSWSNMPAEASVILL